MLPEEVRMSIKRKTVLWAAGLGLGLGCTWGAQASYIITLASQGGSLGAYTYTYDVSLDALQKVTPGDIGTTGNPSFFSVLDIGTYTSIGETGLLSTDYTFSNPLVSPKAFDQNPPDSPLIANVQADYIGTATLAPLTALGTFTITTTIGPSIRSDVSYEAQSIKAVGNAAGLPAGNTTFTSGPAVHVPEPSTFALLATGFVGLGFIRRRRVS